MKKTQVHTCHREYIVIPSLMAAPYPEEPQFTPAPKDFWKTDWKLLRQREEIELSLHRVRKTLEEHKKLPKPDPKAIAEMEQHIEAVERTLRTYDYYEKKKRSA